MFNDANMWKLNLLNFNGSKIANIASMFSAMDKMFFIQKYS